MLRTAITTSSHSHCAVGIIEFSLTKTFKGKLKEVGGNQGRTKWPKRGDRRARPLVERPVCGRVRGGSGKVTRASVKKRKIDLTWNILVNDRYQLLKVDRC